VGGENFGVFLPDFPFVFQRMIFYTGTLYWFGVGGEVLAESDLSGNLTGEYVYFGGQQIARLDASVFVTSGTWAGTRPAYFYLADRLGTARMIVKQNISNYGSTQTVTTMSESDYYPYGGERVVTGSSSDNKYKFTGHERDSESGLDHTLYRQYASNTARWLAPDIKWGSAVDPQTWNRYSYTAGNPISRIDSDGASWLDLFFYDEKVAYYYSIGRYVSDVCPFDGNCVQITPPIYGCDCYNFDGNVTGYSVNRGGGGTITLSPDFVKYLESTDAVKIIPALGPFLDICLASTPCVITVGSAIVLAELAIWLHQQSGKKNPTADNHDGAVDSPYGYPGDDAAHPKGIGDGWTWAGNGTPESGEGNWVRGDERLHPDLNHPEPKGKHWGYTDPNGNKWDIWSDNTMSPQP
jgi:RHS repeat-associated protein